MVALVTYHCVIDNTLNLSYPTFYMSRVFFYKIFTFIVHHGLWFIIGINTLQFFLARSENFAIYSDKGAYLFLIDIFLVSVIIRPLMEEYIYRYFLSQEERTKVIYYVKIFLLLFFSAAFCIRLFISVNRLLYPYYADAFPIVLSSPNYLILPLLDILIELSVASILLIEYIVTKFFSRVLKKPKNLVQPSNKAVYLSMFLFVVSHIQIIDNFLQGRYLVALSLLVIISFYAILYTGVVLYDSFARAVILHALINLSLTLVRGIVGFRSLSLQFTLMIIFIVVLFTLDKIFKDLQIKILRR